MNRRYPLSTRPLRLSDDLVLKNRLAFTSMGVDLADENGCATPQMTAFYKGVIEGGCAMAFLGNATVSAGSRLHSRGLALFNDAQRQSMRAVQRMASAAGVPVAVQLQHYGGQGAPLPSGAPLLTPSGIGCSRAARQSPGYRVQAMTPEHIAQVIDEFASAAWRAWQSGARVVQLQAANGYLLSSFLSPRFNQRTDAYGGSEENRARLLLEVIRAIRARTDNGLIVTVRLGIDDLLGDEGLQFTELEETVQALNQSGICALECSMSVGASFHRLFTPSREMDNYLHTGVKVIKGSANVPVGFAGFIDGLDKAERLLGDEVCDWVGMSRALFADNQLINKTLQGRARDVDRCLWDGRCFSDKSDPRMSRVFCCVNPNYPRPTFN
ncbi:NADH:flavin oxidoreductase [Pseudomonas sp. NPDC088444]|uniref:oxidoreductase n=1 Tax=Pseudomonas sp. NPDC088444 TaxID=3364456 RepID=UPI00385087E0